jgi:DNA-binding NarL/FixJ family response regulator
MRVLLANMPPLLRDVLSEALADELDMSVVGGATVDADLMALVRQLSPDVVIAQASREAARAVARELHAVSFVAITPDGRRVLVFAPGEEPLSLSDVSPTTIIAAIRSLSRNS